MSGIGAAVSAAGSRAASRRKLTDRLNPILVKEVRQALRGRYFRILFWLTLFVATLVGLVVVATQAGERGTESEEIGQPFFMVMFGCMAAAVHVFTPFFAFLSTSSEWDENTHDLLVLSNLRPHQIVTGKLSSALIQALLYYSTFGPFLVFAFLLNGVDIFSVSVILIGSVATCVGLSLVGIALASLARLRALRGMLMAVFGAGLTMAWIASIGMAGGIVFEPQVLRTTEGQAVFASYLLFVLLVGGLFGLVAAARFAHEEENRSTGLRVLAFALVLVGGAWGAWMHAQTGEEEVSWVGQAIVVVPMFLMWLFILTERETLGRRAALLVSPRPGRALLSAPFLPGGGRGVLLFLVQCGAALGMTWLALQAGTAPAVKVAQSLEEVLVLYLYCFVMLGLPAGIASFRVETQRGRALVRAAIVGAVPVLLLGPALLGLLLGIKDWMEMEHPFNPLWLMWELDRSHASSEAIVAETTLGVAAVLTLLLNVPRLGAGVREVLAASRARRERRGA